MTDIFKGTLFSPIKEPTSGLPGGGFDIFKGTNFTPLSELEETFGKFEEQPTEEESKVTIERSGLNIFKLMQPGLDISAKVGKAIGDFVLDNFLPIVKPTYKKIQEGKAPLQSYIESFKELQEQEKQREVEVKQTYKEAEERGASAWELSKIASQSPMVQRVINMAFMSGRALRVFKPGQMNTKMASDILKVGKNATEKTIKAAFSKALHNPKLYPKLAGIAKESGVAELALLKEARSLLLKQRITPISKQGIKLIEGVAKKETKAVVTVKPKAVTPIKPTIKPPIISKELEPLAEEVTKMEIAPIQQAIRKFDATGSATIARRADGVRLIMKDEGEFVKVGMDTGKLVPTDVKLPSKNFATKEEAIDFIRQLAQGKPKAITQATKEAKPLKPREEIGKEYLGGYRDYVAQIKSLGNEPISFEQWVKYKGIKDLGAEKALPPKAKPVLPEVKRPTTTKERVLAEQRVVRKQEAFLKSLADDVTKELAKPKARQRSTIAFVKRLGEFNQTVVNEVKRELGITKPISQINLQELNNVLIGMKDRLAFKRTRGFKPRVVEKTTKAMEVPEVIYERNVELSKIKQPKKTTIDRAKRAGKGIEIAITPISTRLKNIDPSLKRTIRRFEWNSRMATQKDLKVASAFLEKIKPTRKFLTKRGMTGEDWATYDLALKNGDTTKIIELNKKYNIQREYEANRQMLDNLYQRARDVGYDLGYLKDFHPRIIKDTSKFLEYFSKRDDWSRFDEVIKRKEMALGRILQFEEKAALVNNLIRGYSSGNITLSETGAMKHRIVDFIDEKLNQYYTNSADALVRYVQQVNDAIEARRLFGKSRIVDKKIDQYNNMEDSIGAYVTNLMVKGKITVAQEKELTSILKARLNPRGTSGIIGVYKNLSYIDVMGSPLNALTQIGDLGFSIYSGSLWNVAKEIPRAIFGKSPIKKADLGIERIAEEFADQNTSGRAVNFVFKAIGLEKIDAIGKDTLVNATISKLRTQAKKPSEKFIKELEKTFGKETDQIIKDLASGNITENVKYLSFNKLLDFQPVALSEVPELYLKAGNGRIFYMLKTWTLKMLDVFRNEAFQLMKNKKTFNEGFGNLLKLMGALMAAEMTADTAKDLIMGKKINLKDRAIDSLLKLVTLNRYTLSKAQQQGIGSAFVEKIRPPTQAIDNIWKDVDKILKNYNKSIEANELRTIKSIPFGGKLYYWWFGKGASYNKQSTKKKTNLFKGTGF